jgi:hypothetical protein
MDGHGMQMPGMSGRRSLMIGKGEEEEAGGLGACKEAWREGRTGAWEERSVTCGIRAKRDVTCEVTHKTQHVLVT